MFDQIRQIGSWSCRGVAASIMILAAANQAEARDPLPPLSIIDRAIVGQIQDIAAHPIIAIALDDALASRKALTQSDIDALDQSWRDEADAANRPVITAYLQVPISNYLAHIMAGTHGLLLEAFIADARGLNVGLSVPTSDFFQADESWFNTALALPVGEHFLDTPEYDAELGVWRVRVALPISDGTASGRAGVMSADVNLTELLRRRRLKSGF